MNRQKAQKILNHLTSNPMFIASIRFYVGGLKPGESTILKKPHRDRSRQIHWAWKYYLCAARRLLEIAWGEYIPPDSDSWLMPPNFEWLIFVRTGLNLSDPATRRQFNELPLNFLLHDPLVEAFADAHPHVLEQAKETWAEFYKLDWHSRPRPDHKACMEPGAVIHNGERLKPDISNRKPPSPEQIIQRSAQSYIVRLVTGD